MQTIPGLTYHPEILSPQEQAYLWSCINRQCWSEELKRRIQHYGYYYNYRRRSISVEDKADPLPPWCDFLCRRLTNKYGFPGWPDQLIVNEYEPAQGIADHVDCQPCFGPVIAMISLSSGCVMQFKPKTRTRVTKIEYFLQPGSLMLISDEARYSWTHGIPARKSDLWEGRRHDRTRRISMTFRMVVSPL